MKILHTADWHLGKNLNDFPRIVEQQKVLDEICVIALENKVDLVIVAGDLYDNFNPSSKSQELLYRSLKKLTRKGEVVVIAIAGNHDSPERIESPDILAKENGIFFIGFPQTKLKQDKFENGVEITNSDLGFVELKIPKIDFPVRIITTPYANEIRMKTFLGTDSEKIPLGELLKQKWDSLSEKYCDNSGVNLFIGHLFAAKHGEVIEEPEGEKPILHVGGAEIIKPTNFPKNIQYGALGHLHRKHFVSEDPPIVYPGSPIAYSFSENNQDKFVSIVDVLPGQKANIDFVKLKEGRRLFRKKFDDIQNAILWLRENPYSLVELTIETDEYISGQDRKSLFEAHDGIISIIPKIRNSKILNNQTKNINLDKKIDELFKDYFLKKHGVAANEEIMNLFSEVIAQDKDSEQESLLDDIQDH